MSVAFRQSVEKMPEAPLNLRSQGSAVLIIDVQNDMCSPDGVYARHGLECPSIPPLLGPLGDLLGSCRRLGVRLINVRTEYECDESGNPLQAVLHFEKRPFLKKEGLRPGTWGAQTVEGLPPPDDEILKGFSFSSFYRTNLENLLRELDIETLILTGIYTNYCVQATAMDAYQRNFRVVVAHDMMTTWDPEVGRGALKTLSTFADVIGAEEVLRHLGKVGQKHD